MVVDQLGVAEVAEVAKDHGSSSRTVFFFFFYFHGILAVFTKLELDALKIGRSWLAHRDWGNIYDNLVKYRTYEDRN